MIEGLTIAKTVHEKKTCISLNCEINEQMLKIQYGDPQAYHAGKIWLASKQDKANLINALELLILELQK